MKYITFVVPSYNSEKWLNKCVDSLLVGGDDVEIIIVNDGSKDNTLAIARKYEEENPGIVKVVDQENKGHGGGLHAGIVNGTGLYFKCVDSDDWVDKDAYLALLNQMKIHEKENNLPDCYVTNFVYENLEKGTSDRYGYTKMIPVGKTIDFKPFRHMKIYNFLMMHSLTIKLEVVRKADIQFPLHTFYVDNLLVYESLFYINSLYQMDIDFYRYYVGRPNQSVTYENMTKNYDHQLRTIDVMAKRFTMDDFNSLDKYHRKVVYQDLLTKLYLTYFYVFAKETPEKKEAYQAFLKDFEENNPELYKKVRYHSIYTLSFWLLPLVRKSLIKIGYKIVITQTGWN